MIHMKSIALLLLTGIALGLAFAGPPVFGQNTQARPNVVFILVDDLRWDELGIAGHPYVKTPNIDRIGREGDCFETRL